MKSTVNPSQMTNTILHVAFFAQKSITYASYLLYRLACWLGHKSRIDWALGTEEIAGLLGNFGRSIPNSRTYSLVPHPFYPPADVQAPSFGGPALRRIQRLLWGAWHLGRISAESSGVMYFGTSGFITNTVDQRQFEFAYLKKRGLKIISFQTGTDVRSMAMMHTLQEESGEENFGTYQRELHPQLASSDHEIELMAFARVIDKHADLIVNAPYDQASYITREVYPYFYALSPKYFNPESISIEGRIQILHAPSSPFIKGTPLVRAAIRKLQLLGYEFDYVELAGVPNDEVLARLRDSHIVLNEFYGFMPGMFAVEAMAARCAVLTRADPNFEKILPADSVDAWIVTPPYEIFNNLKDLLDNPSRIIAQAEAGHAWAAKYCLSSNSMPPFLNKLDALLSKKGPKK
jgi:hypothetical protein